VKTFSSELANFNVFINIFQLKKLSIRQERFKCEVKNFRVFEQQLFCRSLSNIWEKIYGSVAFRVPYFERYIYD
jgi:hypothetical protein